MTLQNIARTLHTLTWRGKISHVKRCAMGSVDMGHLEGYSFLVSSEEDTAVNTWLFDHGLRTLRIAEQDDGTIATFVYWPKP